MRVKCVTIQGRGLLFKDNSHGLTVGKEYDILLSHTAMTDVVDERHVRFFLYNDLGEWTSYHPYFFAPV